VKCFFMKYLNNQEHFQESFDLLAMVKESMAKMGVPSGWVVCVCDMRANV
jgi:hypothetical protein